MAVDGVEQQPVSPRLGLYPRHFGEGLLQRGRMGREEGERCWGHSRPPGVRGGCALRRLAARVHSKAAHALSTGEGCLEGTNLPPLPWLCSGLPPTSLSDKPHFASPFFASVCARSPAHPLPVDCIYHLPGFLPAIERHHVERLKV